MAWLDVGVTVVVTLLRDDEPHFKGIQEVCARAGLLWLHLPLSGKKSITKTGVARNEADTASLRRVSEVAMLLRDGESVVVHCAAGMHRTGAVCYIALRLLGYNPEQALDKILQTRPVTHHELTKEMRRHAPLQKCAELVLSELNMKVNVMC